MLAESHAALDELDIHFPTLTQPIESLSGGQRQAVAIARAVYWDARLMIMDEPTNNLGVPEQQKVLELIRKLRDQGVPVILITHTLPDVFAVCDRIVVMHRGRKVTDKRIAETDTGELVHYMVGALDDFSTSRRTASAEKAGNRAGMLESAGKWLALCRLTGGLPSGPGSSAQDDPRRAHRRDPRLPPLRRALRRDRHRPRAAPGAVALGDGADPALRPGPRRPRARARAARSTTPPATGCATGSASTATPSTTAAASPSCPWPSASPATTPRAPTCRRPPSAPPPGAPARSPPCPPSG